jgi:hypothetical protein
MKIKVTKWPTLVHSKSVQEPIGIPSHWGITKSGAKKYMDEYIGYIEKQVPIENPYVWGEINIEVDKFLSLGGKYKDQNGIEYIATCTLNFDYPTSYLKSIKVFEGEKFIEPTELTLIF